MRNILPFVAVILALALLALACDSDGGPATTPSPSPGQTPTTQPSPTPTQQPSPMATIEETPSTDTSSPTPTPMPTAMVIPAIGPTDITQLDITAPDFEDCLFDPRSTLATCPGRGTYAPDPPIIGEDISCSIVLIADQPILLLCRSEDPPQAIYYTIQ